jgi:Ca2+-binding EF-hand superfamily protein
MIEENDMKKIRSLFQEIDENGDGFLSYEEINDVMQKSNKKDFPKKIFEALDSQKTGMVSYEDFITALMDKKQLKIKKNIKKCFDAIDENKNGNVSLNELMKVTCVSASSEEKKEFKKLFYQHSKGKEDVRFISCHLRNFSY